MTLRADEEHDRQVDTLVFKLDILRRAIVTGLGGLLPFPKPQTHVQPASLGTVPPSR